MTDLTKDDIEIEDVEYHYGIWIPLESESEAEALKKQILEWQEFYIMYRAMYDEINTKAEKLDSYHYEKQVAKLQDEIKQLKEEVSKVNDKLGNQLQILTFEKNSLEKQIQKVREWYGINQIHIPSKEAIKMIKILGKKND